MENMLTICRVCGHDHGDFIWGEDGNTASFEICDCCGTEFGYEDATLEGIIKKRKEWIDSGAHWNNSKAKPQNWTLEKALESIPEKYREPLMI